ncbi:hypothetical protein SDC9_150642 [bioreactor metagenome]|uniref:Uncharacterized protein n=1 Tax=bioreactor metagenome TaxID=1076179 RepID=A0A645EQ66_9ZZZZ
MYRVFPTDAERSALWEARMRMSSAATFCHLYHCSLKFLNFLKKVFDITGII